MVSEEIAGIMFVVAAISDRKPPRIPRKRLFLGILEDFQLSPGTRILHSTQTFSYEIRIRQ
jgi:hypothetical protein